MKQHFCPAEQSMIAFEKECNWCGELESQEPVGWMHVQGNYEEPSFRQLDDDEVERGWEQYPLYTHPPQRTWVGLTDEERDYLWEKNRTKLGGWAYGGDEVMYDRHFEDAVIAIEAKLKEKNT